MPLAKYFAKNIISISQVLNNTSLSRLENILEKQVVEIAFDHDIKTFEGFWTVDLLVKLVCRLYPKVKFTDLTGCYNYIVVELIQEARRINSNIQLVDERPTVTLVVGKTTIKNIEEGKCLYLGSNKWISRYSRLQPVGSGESLIPFAAGFAACAGAANLFKLVFSEHLHEYEIDEEFSFSLLDLQHTTEQGDIVLPQSCEITLVGAGAIGNGFIWSLSKLNKIGGIINIIDHERVALSNLQRYVLAYEKDIGAEKVEIPIEFFKKSNFELRGHALKWEEYASQFNGCRDTIVATAVDSARDRIAVQSSLPKVIFNGYTEKGISAITRHTDFCTRACLCCIYLPNGKKQSKSEEVAMNLGIPQFERQFVREYLFHNKPVDESLLQLISNANKIDIQILRSYLGTPMSEFYSNFVCGGTILTLLKENNNEVKIEAPLAFQSALSGIILASEVLLWIAGYRRSKFEIVSQFYPLMRFTKLSNPYNHNISKDQTGRCICQDEYYKQAYKLKWNNE